MTEPSVSRRRGLVVVLLVLLAALFIYWGVTKTARDARSVPRPAAGDPLHAELFRPWDSLSLATAQEQNRLIVLVVTDTRSRASRELLELAVRHSGWSQSGAIGLTVDRRLRPDLALRYANEAAPFALLLLPTGEALAALDVEPSGWGETIAEVDRYWREHPEEIQKRVDDFWAEEESRAISGRAPRPPEAGDLESIDHAVRDFIAAVLGGADASAGLWRVDISTYLAARAPDHPASDSLLSAIHRARAERWTELFDTVAAPVPPFGVAQIALEELGARVKDAGGRERATAAADWLTGLTPPLTAAETAALAALERALGRQDSVPTFPGAWLGTGATSSLPHLATQGPSLDGYLVDALLWLELLVTGASESELSQAERLADSMWAGLWSSEAHALRDKPLRPTLVREIARYPRAQMGKAALLLGQLHQRTGQARWRQRADSCLAGFAPYTADAGSASAYFGAALVAARSYR
jgi:hypothetical protein